jgi:hypothetical protein
VRTAWWQEQQDEVMDGFLVKPQNQGRAWTTWEPSHEWRLAEATPSSRGFQWFTRKPLGSLVDHKAKTEEPKTEMQHLQTGLTGVRRRSPKTSKRRTRVGIAGIASRLSKFAVTGHPSNGAMTKISEFTLEGYVSLIS